MSARDKLVESIEGAAATMDDALANLEELLYDVESEAMLDEQKRCLAWLRSGLSLAECIDKIEEGLLLEGGPDGPEVDPSELGTRAP